MYPYCGYCQLFGHDYEDCLWRLYGLDRNASRSIQATIDQKEKAAKRKDSQLVKSDLKKAKDKAWKAFSIYIRTRDCIRFSGFPGEGMCITCRRRYSFKQLQAGHFIAGRHNAVLFDVEAVYSQCYACNVGRNGAHVQYFLFMEQEHGRQKVDEIIARSNQTVKYKLGDYLMFEDHFKRLTRVILDDYKEKLHVNYN